MSPGYLATFGGRLLRGRFIADEDLTSVGSGIVVNDAFVRQFGNGTDGMAMPVLTQAVAMNAPTTAAQANVGLGLGDFANANVPSVWRHGRSGSAAAKVEALSSNGMDEIEIPAFLRKQAD